MQSCMIVSFCHKKLAGYEQWDGSHFFQTLSHNFMNCEFKPHMHIQCITSYYHNSSSDRIQ